MHIALLTGLLDYGDLVLLTVQQANQESWCIISIITPDRKLRKVCQGSRSLSYHRFCSQTRPGIVQTCASEAHPVFTSSASRGKV